MRIKINSTRIRRLLRILGPGLITVASENDPSDIATYYQAGARFGVGSLWAAILTFPLMVAIQEMCARIDIAMRQELTGTLKNVYNIFIIYILLIIIGTAIILNIGADIAGMGAVVNLIAPAKSLQRFSILFSGIGTGFLAILVLSAKLASIKCEAFGWEGNLDKKYYEAKPFYLIILLSLILVLIVKNVGISPVKALIYTAILHGLTFPILITHLLDIVNNKYIMKGYSNSRISNVLGILRIDGLGRVNANLLAIIDTTPSESAKL